MKAIQLKAYGRPIEDIGVVELSEPRVINNDEAVIEVLYSPVNPSDLLLAWGTYPVQPQLPSVIGGEGVGRVVSIVSEAKKATNSARITLGLDAVGGKATNSIAEILGYDSYLISYAIMSGEPAIVNPVHLIFKQVKIHGFFMYLPQYLPKLKSALLESARLLKQGKINVPVSEVYPPEKVKEAIQHTLRGGKVLLQFNA